jgi:hypothetical protein
MFYVSVCLSVCLFTFGTYTHMQNMYVCAPGLLQPVRSLLVRCFMCLSFCLTCIRTLICAHVRTYAFLCMHTIQECIHTIQECLCEPAKFTTLQEKHIYLYIHIHIHTNQQNLRHFKKNTHTYTCTYTYIQTNKI